MNRQCERGFSLFELILFIVVMGILGSTLFVSYRHILLNADLPGQLAIAGELAQARMELILGQRQTQGFSVFTDPCDGSSPPSICSLTSRTLPNNLPLSPSLAEATIVVTGTSPDGTTVSLSSLVGNY